MAVEASSDENFQVGVGYRESGVPRLCHHVAGGLPGFWRERRKGKRTGPLPHPAMDVDRPGRVVDRLADSLSMLRLEVRCRDRNVVVGEACSCSSGRLSLWRERLVPLAGGTQVDDGVDSGCCQFGEVLFRWLSSHLDAIVDPAAFHLTSFVDERVMHLTQSGQVRCRRPRRGQPPEAVAHAR